MNCQRALGGPPPPTRGACRAAPPRVPVVSRGRRRLSSSLAPSSLSFSAPCSNCRISRASPATTTSASMASQRREGPPKGYVNEKGRLSRIFSRSHRSELSSGYYCLLTEREGCLEGQGQHREGGGTVISMNVFLSRTVQEEKTSKRTHSERGESGVQPGVRLAFLCTRARVAPRSDSSSPVAIVCLLWVLGSKGTRPPPLLSGRDRDSLLREGRRKKGSPSEPRTMRTPLRLN